MRILFTLGLFLAIGADAARPQAASDAHATKTRDSCGLVDYYATLAFRESPYAAHRGLHRLSAEEASRINHYRFEYDRQGRIQQISFRLGDTLRAANHTANYFWYASVENYRYQRDAQGRPLQIVSYADQHGRATKVHGEVYQSRYVLDDSGRRLSLSYHDEAGRPTESRWSIASYAWTHQDDGSVWEQRRGLDGEPVSLRPGFPFQRVRLSYAANGLTMLMQQIDEQGRVIGSDSGFAQDRFTYTPYGELARYEVLDAQGKPGPSNMTGIASGLQTFTERGYEHIASYLDAAGQPAYNDNGWWRSERRYDAHGNLLLNAFADRDGRRANNPNTGYAELRLDWHDDGLRRRQLGYFDAQGQPVEHRNRGMHAVHYRYDPARRLQMVYLLDRQGRLVEHAEQGWAVTRYSYDGDQAVGVAERMTLRQAQQENLQHILSQLQRLSGVPGMAAAVAENGELLWHGEAGVVDLQTQAPVVAATQFRLASVSKAVTSILVGRALAAGQIRLNDRADALTELSHPATLAQLLAHSGAVAHYGPLSAAMLDRDYANSTAALPVVKSHVLEYPPGREYRYSTFGYTLVGAMLEAATGRSFSAQLRALAVEQNLPSLATSSAEHDNPNLTGFYAAGDSGPRPARKRNFSYADPGAGLIANASDLALLVHRFASAHLIPAGVLETMLRVQALADGSAIVDQRYQVALGWRRQADAAGNVHFHHGGVTDGARSVVMFEPGSARSVALLGNAAWTSDVYNIGLSLLAVQPTSHGLSPDRAAPLLLSHDGATTPLPVQGCQLTRCTWAGPAEAELARWLQRSGRGAQLRVESDLFGARLYSAYGVSPFIRRGEQLVATVGSRQFMVQAGPDNDRTPAPVSTRAPARAASDRRWADNRRD